MHRWKCWSAQQQARILRNPASPGFLIHASCALKVGPGRVGQAMRLYHLARY